MNVNIQNLLSTNEDCAMSRLCLTSGKWRLSGIRLKLTMLRFNAPVVLENFLLKERVEEGTTHLLVILVPNRRLKQQTTYVKV